MSDLTAIQCGDFRIELRSRRLMRADVVVPIRPKAWTLLLYLLENPGRAIATDEIGSKIWPDVAVGDDSIRKTVRELRAALGDSARNPTYLETVHGVGIRFIAPISRQAPESGANLRPHVAPHRSGMVGRRHELELLHQALARASAGSRQVLFIMGEPGIGKSTIVRAFAESVESMPLAPRLLFAQSIGRSDGAEAYGPLLDSLETLRQSEPGLDPLMRRHARRWYSQLPGGESSVAVESDAAPTRMLREGMQLFDAIAAERTLVIVLEDGHASDHASIDLVEALARRRVAARILVVVTFRRSDAVASNHPIVALSADLGLKKLATNVSVTPFGIGDAVTLLEDRLGKAPDARSLASLLVARSRGNPLFLTALLDYLVSSGALKHGGGAWQLTVPLENVARLVPSELRSLVAAIAAALPDDAMRMLETAAVAGTEFDARTVASTLGCDAVEVEHLCNALVAQERMIEFLHDVAWEDGTSSARYKFVHELYQEALQQRVPASLRKQIHLRVAERLECGAGSHAGRIAAELAPHFVRGGEDRKAVKYFLIAAERANHRGAHPDAIAALRHALAILDVPDPDEKQGFRLLRVLLALAGSVSMLSGFADLEFESLMTRARVLSESLGALPTMFLGEFGVQASLLMQARIEEASESSLRLISLAETIGLPQLRGAAFSTQGWTRIFAGDFAGAKESFRIAGETDIQSSSFDSFGALGAVPDLHTYVLTGRALASALLGEVELAADEALAAVEHSAARRPGDRAVALTFSAFIHAILGNDAAAAAYAADTQRIVEEEGEGDQFRHFADAVASIVSLPMNVAALEETLAAASNSRYRAIVSEIRAMAASRMLDRGEVRAAQAMMDACDRDCEPCWTPELLRISAELLLRAGGNQVEAKAMLQESLRLAYDQKSGLWERRARSAIASLPHASRTAPRPADGQ